MSAKTLFLGFTDGVRARLRHGGHGVGEVQLLQLSHQVLLQVLARNRQLQFGRIRIRAGAV